MSTSSSFDIHHEITNRIVAAIESAGEFQLPWISARAGPWPGSQCRVAQAL